MRFNTLAKVPKTLCPKKRSTSLILPLLDAVRRLAGQYPDTTFICRALDIACSAAVKTAWDIFESDGLMIDVLVLNAARVQFHHVPLLDRGHAAIL